MKDLGLTILFILSFMFGASLHALDVRSQNIKLPSQYVFDSHKVIPNAASTTLLLANHAGATSASAVIVKEFDAQPDVARNLVFTPGGTTADFTTGNIVVSGVSQGGKSISETLAVAIGQSSAITGDKAFSKVLSINFPGEGTTFAGTWSVGVGNKLGLPDCLDGAGYYYNTLIDGAIDSSDTVAVSASDAGSNTVLPSSVPNGSREYDLIFIGNFGCRP